MSLISENITFSALSDAILLERIMPKSQIITDNSNIITGKSHEILLFWTISITIHAVIPAQRSS